MAKKNASLLSSRMNKVSAGQEPQTDTPVMEPAAVYDATLEQEAERQQVKSKRTSLLKSRLAFTLQICLIVLCVYVAFLIYGVSTTRYVYTEQGQITPETLTVSDMRSLAEYEAFSTYYLRARILYEEAMTLDYRLSIAPDSALVVAMDYTALLDDVAKLSVDISAAEYDTGYSSIYGQLLNWVKTDIAVYLQNMAGAITENDAEKANNALISRDVMYADFSKLTANAVALARSTKGADNLDIYDWSPEAFSESLAEGV